MQLDLELDSVPIPLVFIPAAKNCLNSLASSDFFLRGNALVFLQAKPWLQYIIPRVFCFPTFCFLGNVLYVEPSADSF